MKNTLALVLALAVVSSPAYASRARLEALGEGKNGSYYINDARNMFLNPASITKHKKKLMLELGGDTVGAVDNAAAARAQGGFINTFGDFTYALYLNNTSDRAITTLGADINGGGVADFLAPSNGLEFTVAGEGMVNWGVALLTGGNRGVSAAGNAFGAGAEQRSNYLAARFGVEKDAAAVFGNVGINSSSKVITGSANPEIKGKLSLDLGATYKMDSMTVFGKFTQTGADLVNSTAGATAATTVEARTTSYGLGAAWDKEMTKSTHMFTRVEAAYSQTTQTGAVAQTAFNVPVTLGAETQALSWLAVRGSVGHSIVGQNITARNGFAGSTTVAAGVGLTFGDISIDGLVATNNNPSVDTLGMGTSPAASDNLGFGDNMISRIAMTYNF